MHWSRSLKGRAVAVQLLSCPVFLAGGIVAWQQWQRSPAAGRVAGLVAVMLLAEGLGQALLAVLADLSDGE